jgi:hypothetical protein
MSAANNEDNEVLNSSTIPSVVLDSLPYVDAVNEDYEQYALALIEDEMKQQTAEPTLIPEIRFRSSFLQSEYEQRSSNRPGRKLPPMMTATTIPSDSAPIQEGKDAVRTARIAYEKERIRGMVLEVDKDTSADRYKSHHEMLQQLLFGQQELLKNQLQAVQEINLQRQQYQLGQAAPSLSQFETQYAQLLQKRHQLQAAVDALEQDIAS